MQKRSFLHAIALAALALAASGVMAQNWDGERRMTPRPRLMTSCQGNGDGPGAPSTVPVSGFPLKRPSWRCP